MRVGGKALSQVGIMALVGRSMVEPQKDPILIWSRLLKIYGKIKFMVDSVDSADSNVKNG